MLRYIPVSPIRTIVWVQLTDLTRQELSSIFLAGMEEVFYDKLGSVQEMTTNLLTGYGGFRTGN